MKIRILLVFLIMLNLKNTLLANEIVNTASRCGFTPQYADLQNLFLNYKNSDLTIIATTSNSFNQEYLDTEDIKQICLVNYGVGFVTSSPMDVKGSNTHPILSLIHI